MTSIDEIVRELTGLYEKATGAGWLIEPRSRGTPAGQSGPYIAALVYNKERRTIEEKIIARVHSDDDKRLIVAAKNRLPALLSALARSRRMEEALRRWESSGCPDCGGDCAAANPPVTSCIMQETRKALEAHST